MSRIVRITLAAAAVAALAPLGAAHAGPDPVCKLYWYEQPDLDPSDGTVSPGRAGWVC